MVLRLPLESHWWRRESHVARHAIGVGILELLGRMHRVAPRCSGVRVPEQLLQASLWNAALDGVNGDGNADVVAIAIVFVATGAFALYKGNSDRKAAENAFQFVVRMRSASGEQQIYVSRDEAHVRRIVSALNTAIHT